MFKTAWPVRHAGAVLVLVVGLVVSDAVAQVGGGAVTAPAGEFLTGRAAQAWTIWQAAMVGVLDRDEDRVEAAFQDLLRMEPSAFRVALLEQRTINDPALGGAILLLEQDHEAGVLGP